MKNQGAVVTRVVPGTLADELGIEPKDRLISINGEALEDVIDLRFLIADEYVELEVAKPDGEVWILEADKEFDEELGVELQADTFDGIRRCKNRCVFCFVDQMPPGMRDTLYVKDDDYRLSFLHGNFVTGTNLDESDLNRIMRMHLSPVYISVHTTNPELRVKMLKNPHAGKILEHVQLLIDNDIDIHTQIVLCPEFNDGEELDRTISELGNLWPGIKSIAAVPVGLTGYRQGLSPLQTFNRESAQKVIDQVTKWQYKFQQELGYPLVFLGDEFYLLAEAEIPADQWYGDYPQTENGIGLVRIFWDTFAEAIQGAPKRLDELKEYAIVTGVSGAKVLEPIVNQLRAIENLQVQLITVENDFFGPSITVSGLVTGQDIIKNLQNIELPGEVLIPSVMLKSDEAVFLDGMTVEQLALKIQRPVSVVDVSAGAQGLVEKLVG